MDYKIGKLNNTEKMYQVISKLNREIQTIQIAYADKITNEMIRDLKNSNNMIVHVNKYVDPAESIFQQINKPDFMAKRSIIFLAWTPKELIGYSAWEYHPGYKEFCYAQQLYVRSKYRRQGFGRKLIACNLPNIHGILACDVNKISRDMYNKHFHQQVVFGRINRDKGYIPESSEMITRQMFLWQHKNEEWIAKGLH